MASRTDSPMTLPPATVASMKWRRAFRAFRELMKDSDDTAKALDLTMAIGARDFERNFQRFLASSAGQALLRERPSLSDALSDRAALERLPGSSLGRAYLEYIDRNGFHPTGLIALTDETEARWAAEEGREPLDPVRRWYHDRTLLGHDLFHILTGYGTDDIGEATLLAFTFAQIPGRANGLLTVGAALEAWRSLGSSWLRYDLHAWRRGRRAAWLVALPWEDLLPVRLETVRRVAGVEPPEVAHPDGILAGTIDEHGEFVPA